MLEIHFRFCTALHDINPFVGFLFFLMQELWKWGSMGWLVLMDRYGIAVFIFLLGLSWLRIFQSSCRSNPFGLLSEAHDMGLGLQHCFQSN